MQGLGYRTLWGGLLCGLVLLGGWGAYCWAGYEADPLWEKPSLPKKVIRVGQRLLADNEIQEAITFSISCRSADQNQHGNAYADDAWASVVIQDGLLGIIDNDDELAGVLAHEMAHILYRHATPRRVGRVASTMLVTAPLTVAGAAAGGLVGAMAGQRLGTFLTRRADNLYTRPKELEADRLAIDLMANAGYEPEAMYTVIAKLAGDGSALRAWRSHPGGTERLRALRTAIDARAERDDVAMRSRFGTLMPESDGPDSSWALWVSGSDSPEPMQLGALR